MNKSDRKLIIYLNATSDSDGLTLHVTKFENNYITKFENNLTAFASSN